MTRLFGVIGDPITHSLSPVMHTAALRAMKVDACYAPFQVPTRVLAPCLRALVLAGVEGLNVTVPLKEAVMPLLDRVDPTAAAVGAVNTIVIRNRRSVGFNTDVAGFERALRELGWRPRAARVLILGAGGAARAVAWALSRHAGTEVTIANRHRKRAVRLAGWLRRLRPRVRVRVIGLREATGEGIDLLINATTVGLRRADRAVIDTRTLHRKTLVYELVYHRCTPLVAGARRRGCVAANGLSMLLYQGSESLRLWLRRPPVETMRRALRRAIDG